MASTTCDRRTVVTIVSTMRSGSTLLKALLAEADDISSLPEVNFQKYAGQDARALIESLDDAPIIVLKRPAWYHETSTYPRLPNVEPLKMIALVRDAYETVTSLKKMTFRRAHRMVGNLADRFLLSYWCKVVSTIADLSERTSAPLVRYEDLVANPVTVTRGLFQYLESERIEGTDQYSAPSSYEWKWGKDDGGPRIRELRVLPPVPHGYKDRGLVEAIQRMQDVVELRQRLGYDDLA